MPLAYSYTYSSANLRTRTRTRTHDPVLVLVLILIARFNQALVSVSYPCWPRKSLVLTPLLMPNVLTRTRSCTLHRGSVLVPVYTLYVDDMALDEWDIGNGKTHEWQHS